MVKWDRWWQDIRVKWHMYDQPVCGISMTRSFCPEQLSQQTSFCKVEDVVIVASYRQDEFDRESSSLALVSYLWPCFGQFAADNWCWWSRSLQIVWRNSKWSSLLSTIHNPVRANLYSGTSWSCTKFCCDGMGHTRYADVLYQSRRFTLLKYFLVVVGGEWW